MHSRIIRGSITSSNTISNRNNQYNQPLNSGNVGVNGGNNSGGNGGGNGGKKKTGLIIGIIAAVVVIVAAIIIAIVIKNKNSDKDDSKDKKTTEAASTEDIATTDDVTDDTTDEVTEAIPDDDWIHISTPEEFQKIADNLDGKYVLDADIDDWMSGNSTSYTPIGTPDMPFTGELDGAGHSISGTLLFTGNDEAWGFFGCNEGYIHDLTLSYVQCVEMDNRYIDAWDTEHTYATLDKDGLPTETTKYYSILCGINRGTIENITSDYGIDLNLYPNDNEKIYLGYVCAYNEGTISGVNLSGSNLYYRTFDKDTAADVGLVCGYQTASAVLDNVTLDYCNIDLDSFGEFVGNVAPTVYLGMLIGEANCGTPEFEGMTTSHSFPVTAGSTYYLAALAGCAVGNVTVEGCVIDVEYNLTGGGAILHSAEDTNGFYNNP